MSGSLAKAQQQKSEESLPSVEPETVKPIEPILKPSEPVKSVEKVKPVQSPVQTGRSQVEPLKPIENAKPVESVKSEESKQHVESVKHIEPVEVVKPQTVVPVQATVEELHRKPEPVKKEEVKYCYSSGSILFNTNL